MPQTQKTLGSEKKASAWRNPWPQLRWSLPFLAALLPIVLLTLFAYRVASHSVTDLVQSQNVLANANVSQTLTQDFKRMFDIAHAIASSERTLDAVRRQDDIAMRLALRSIILTYPQVDRVFLTDRKGVLWADSAQILGEYRKSQEKSDWYRGVSLNWKPYVSSVYVRPFDPEQHPVVAIARPVFDETGRVIGAMVLEYRTSQIRRWVQDARLGRSGYVFILDQKGNVVAHPQLSEKDLNTAYRSVEPIIRSRSGSVFLTQEYTDPVSGERMIASFQPLSISRSPWVVVAQQPVEEAYAVLHQVRFRISLAGGLLTLITCGMVIALAYMERRNELLNRALASKNQTLQDITSFVSHQLRAPVTAMRWNIEEIIDGDTGPIGEQTKKSLQELHDVAIQNGKLIDDILNVSRIDRGVIEVTAAAVPLKDIAERAMRDYHLAAEKAGLTLTLQEAKKPITVQADKEKMAESVTNAISNAIKHTKAGGITLSLRCDDQFGYIDVTDTGEGMPPEIIAKLFNRAGIKGSNTDSAQSTGLGLFIARNFMQLQGGDILVTSVPGRGSTFSYKIPLAVAGKKNG